MHSSRLGSHGNDSLALVCEGVHTKVRVLNVHWLCATKRFSDRGNYAMDIAQHPSAVASQYAVRNLDGWIVIGYAAFAVVALVAIYFASGGPGIADADLTALTVLP
ncbi:hypothetical protein ACVWXO_004739 [Bradyrhizobium sp. LM2.7]